MANAVFKELEKGNLPGLKRCLSLFPTAASTKNSAGATPLHIAAALGQAPFVKELLLHGAPHDTADSQGNLPLHLAAEQGSLESVIELVTGPGRKLALKAKNKDGQTPLHLAVRNSHTAVAARLLEAGARSDAKDKSGNTPLELVSPNDEELLQLLLASTPTSAFGSTSMGFGVSAVLRGSADTPSSVNRASPSSGNTSSRIASMPQQPTARTPLAGTPSSARASSHIPQSGTPAGTGSRLPRSNAGPGGAGHQPGSGSGGTAVVAAAAAAGGSATTGPTVNSQLQKHEAAIQTLQADLRTVTERLGTVDACASAQLECSAQVEKALAACGSHGQMLSELEARVGFQEDRGRDTRSRIERLEEGERSVQDSVSRLTVDHRSLNSQLRALAEQVASAKSDRQASNAEASTSQQLHADIAGLRAQLELLSPALGVATTASAEARTLASRLDALQLQVQQGQQQQQQQPQHAGGAALEQQVLQLQAQVQLLQLPVASLTQQCADLSSKLSGLTEWQQQARADIAKLTEAAAATERERAGGSGTAAGGGELSEAVMRVLDTTAQTMAELRQQQEATAKQVAELLQQQRPAIAPGTPLNAGVPALPSTPIGSIKRSSGGGTDPGLGPLGGPPSRNMNSAGGFSREGASQADLRTELEALKELVADVRKEVASEGGSLRREWQRTFSEMQTRYGEQANELQRREANIKQLREAALVEEAERRTATAFEDKVSKRLTKMETGLEYLTHRLEVLEEQVSGMASTLAGGNSPGTMLSPTVLAAAMAAAAAPRQPAAGPGPGPVSENSRGMEAARLAVAAASVASSPLALSKVNTAAKVASCSPAAAAALAAMAGGVGGQGGLVRRGPLFGEPTAPAASSPRAQRGGVSGVPAAAAQCQAQPRPAAHIASGPEAPGGGAAVSQAPLCSAPALPAAALSSTATQADAQFRTVAPSGLNAAGSMVPLGDWHSDDAGVVDPAHIALAPQLLPASAQALLTPSMDIQRLAAVAAAAAAQQQQQPTAQWPSSSVPGAPALQQQRRQPVPASDAQLQPRAVTGAAAGGTARTGPEQAGPRKEPPMCLYCSVQ